MVKQKKRTKRKSLQPNARENNNKRKKVTKATNKEKNHVIQPIVQRLVEMKVKNNGKRLPKGTIEKEIEILNKNGITWITIDNLRHRVHREHKKVIDKVGNEDVEVVDHFVPPPPPDASRESATAQMIIPPPKKNGRPTNKEKDLLTRCTHEAINEITDLYVEKLKERDESNKKKLPDGTLKKIIDKELEN